MVKEPRIIVLGGGPTGLGAAYRLSELAYSHYHLYEADARFGGLAKSFIDNKGFTWDIGGHVHFSHYSYYDKVLDSVMPPKEWLTHERQAWVFIDDRFVRYPFQNHIHHLSNDSMKRCLQDLIRAQERREAESPSHFQDWVLKTFGKGIAELFMIPYNLKVWAYPLESIGIDWMGERVATVDIKTLLESVSTGADAPSWGPNRMFRFPRQGGTGAIWDAIAKAIPKDRRSTGRKAVAIDTKKRRISFEDGSSDGYDQLISTIPIPDLIKITQLDSLQEASDRLVSNRTTVVGLGLKTPLAARLDKKSWIYFPQASLPFYRATVFSGYSPANVPDPSRHWSLMMESSSSSAKPSAPKQILERSIEGLLKCNFIESKNQIVSTWAHVAPRGYPIPTKKRNQFLSLLIPELETYGIYSRGRFGGWKYEVGNQDHSFMQGVEIVNRLLNHTSETTFFSPETVNSGKFKT